MTKDILRKNMIHELKNIAEFEKEKVEQKLFQQLIDSDLWKNAKTIGITVSQRFEWSTEAIIKKGWEQNKRIAVPKCNPKEKTLQFYLFTNYNQLEVVYYNLREPIPIEERKIKPAEINLLIVPGLLFDYNGYRIGFGGGFYDRFLSDFPNLTISLATREQLKEQLPKESFDIPVQHIVTPSEMIVCNVKKS